MIYPGLALACTRLRVTVLLVLSLLPALFYAEPDRPAPPGYLTILLGRAQVGRCDASINTVPVESVLAELGRRGYLVTGSVVLSRTDDTQDTCVNALRYPSWATLVSWRHRYGFEAVSAGNYQIMTNLTAEQQRAESCGSLPTFAQRGFVRVRACMGAVRSPGQPDHTPDPG